MLKVKISQIYICETFNIYPHNFN